MCSKIKVKEFISGLIGSTLLRLRLLLGRRLLLLWWALVRRFNFVIEEINIKIRMRPRARRRLPRRWNILWDGRAICTIKSGSWGRRGSVERTVGKSGAGSVVGGETGLKPVRWSGVHGHRNQVNHHPDIEENNRRKLWCMELWRGRSHLNEVGTN